MSGWFQQASGGKSFSSLASKALKTAQKKIDAALDIKEEDASAADKDLEKLEKNLAKGVEKVVSAVSSPSQKGNGEILGFAKDDEPSRNDAASTSESNEVRRNLRAKNEARREAARLKTNSTSPGKLGKRLGTRVGSGGSSIASKGRKLNPTKSSEASETEVERAASVKTSNDSESANTASGGLGEVEPNADPGVEVVQEADRETDRRDLFNDTREASELSSPPNVSEKKENISRNRGENVNEVEETAIEGVNNEKRALIDVPRDSKDSFRQNLVEDSTPKGDCHLTSSMNEEVHSTEELEEDKAVEAKDVAKLKDIVQDNDGLVKTEEVCKELGNSVSAGNRAVVEAIPNRKQDDNEYALKSVDGAGDTGELLKAREIQIIKLNEEIVSLRENNTVLRNQLDEAEGALSAEMDAMTSLNDEFSKRIKDHEKRANIACKERDSLRAEVESLKSSYEKKLKALSEQLAESDEKCDALMSEGEALSKQQLTDKTTIKKLRASEKEQSKIVKSYEDKIKELEENLKTTSEKLGAKERELVKTAETVSDMKKLVSTTSRDLQKAKKQLEEFEGEKSALAGKVEALQSETERLNDEAKQGKSKTEEIVQSKEISAREGLKIAVRETEERYEVQISSLKEQMEELIRNNSRLSKQYARSEENLKFEVDELQKRLQNSETRNQELTDSVSMATRPLLRQIQNLQSMHSAQADSWECTERELNGQIEELKGKVTSLQGQEKIASSRYFENENKLVVAQKELALQQEQKVKLVGEMESLKLEIDALRVERARAFAKNESDSDSLNRENQQIRQMLNEARESLGQMRERLDSEAKNAMLMRESLQNYDIENEKLKVRVKELEAESVEKGQTFPSPSVPPAKESSAEALFPSSVGAGNSLVVMERLQRILRAKDVELNDMRSSLESSESERKSLAEEVMKMATHNVELEKNRKNTEELEQQVKDLTARYNAILQMYGEMEEKAEEYKLDLIDIKSAYKSQIETLLTENESLRRGK
eukprot:Nk52_evm33s229 gene=Nk52_evmTU33s229